MPIPMPPRGSATHVLFAGAYLAIGALVIAAILTLEPGATPTGRGAALERLLLDARQALGPGPVVVMAALAAMTGAGVHLALARPGGV